MSQNVWMNVTAFSSILATTTPPTLAGSFASHGSAWKTVFDAEDPSFVPLPLQYDATMTMFQKLCLLRCLRPDKVVPSVVKFVENTLGHKFTEPPGIFPPPTIVYIVYWEWH